MSLDEMQARCDAAMEPFPGGLPPRSAMDNPNDAVREAMESWRKRSDVWSKAQQDFNVHARTDMPRLIAALRVLKEASENVGNELCKMFDDNLALQLGASLSVALARVTSILEGK